MAQASCHNCIYSCWDLGQAVQSMSLGWSHRPMCANHPDSPSLMRPTPIGKTCRNYRPRLATPEGDVRRIPLGGGLHAYVDAADYEWLNQYCWQLYAAGYVARLEKRKVVLMHREIMQPPEGMVVDHIDGNKANNCRVNLRVCTPPENQHNQAKRRGASSQFKGVGRDNRCGKYHARFTHNGIPMWLGYFDDEVEAARAYDYKAVQCCGPFARLNLPEEWPPERIQEVYAAYQAACGNATISDTSSRMNSATQIESCHSREGGNPGSSTTEGTEATEKPMVAQVHPVSHPTTDNNQPSTSTPPPTADER